MNVISSSSNNNKNNNNNIVISNAIRIGYITSARFDGRVDGSFLTDDTVPVSAPNDDTQSNDADHCQSQPLQPDQSTTASSSQRAGAAAGEHGRPQRPQRRARRRRKTDCH